MKADEMSVGVGQAYLSRRTVAGPWDLRVRLTDADVQRRITTVGSRVCCVSSGTIKFSSFVVVVVVFFFFFFFPFLQSAGVALPSRPKRRAFLRRQGRLRLADGRRRATLRSNGRCRRRGSSCSAVVASRLHLLRLVRDTLFASVWHGSLPQLSREDDTARFVRRSRARLCGQRYPEVGQRWQARRGRGEWGGGGGALDGRHGERRRSDCGRVLGSLFFFLWHAVL